MPLEITKPAVVVVEGSEDERFFSSLIQHLGLDNLQVTISGGKDNLKAHLRQLIATPGYIELPVGSLGILRDADQNPRGAFQSVCSHLRGAGLPEPRSPLQSAGDSPRVTVMILPAGDVSRPGMLEDVCLSAVSNFPAMICVDQYFACLGQQGLSLPAGLSKARIQTYLASQEPELRLGEAAEAGYWPWDDPAFERVKDFLRQIASQPLDDM